jgi:hypothetical protein
VGSVLMEKVFAITLTSLPDLPYWRAGAGDTADEDCMVQCFYRCERRKDTRWWNTGWKSDIKRVWRTRMGGN